MVHSFTKSLPSVVRPSIHPSILSAGIYGFLFATEVLFMIPLIVPQATMTEYQRPGLKTPEVDSLTVQGTEV